MNEDLITTTGILEWMKEQVQHKRPIAPEIWLDASLKLNLLKSDDNDLLIEKKHELAVKRASYVNEGGTSVAANIRLEADPLFMEVKKLEAHIETVKEAIRLGKIYARIKNDELLSARYS